MQLTKVLDRGKSKIKVNMELLESLYTQYNRREFVHPDPLEFLYDYDDPLDREVVALIASSLAYGRVEQILKSISVVLERMGKSPYRFLRVTSLDKLQNTFKDFKHRFTTGSEIARFLGSAGCILKKYGSLYSCFKRGFNLRDETVIPALLSFVKKFKEHGCKRGDSLLASPCDGSACKRLNLFMRWMVRRDDVDPGGWDDIPTSKLVVPLDVHMYRICLGLGFTKQKRADLKTTLESTKAFRSINPSDPVRYDFSLTRFGIRDDLDSTFFFKKCGILENEFAL